MRTESSLTGALKSPINPKAVILLVSSQGSTRRNSARTPFERSLERAGYATLKIDISDSGSETDRWNAFDLPGSAAQVAAAVTWLKTKSDLKRLPVGIFCEGVAAASALVAVAGLSKNSDAPSKNVIGAIVCRGGRPDLATEILNQVLVPTLLIVGEEDRPTADLNRSAVRELMGEKEFVMIPGAGHLFDENLAMEQTSRIALKWFSRFLTPREIKREVEATVSL